MHNRSREEDGWRDSGNRHCAYFPKLHSCCRSKIFFLSTTLKHTFGGQTLQGTLEVFGNFPVTFGVQLTSPSCTSDLANKALLVGLEDCICMRFEVFYEHHLFQEVMAGQTYNTCHITMSDFDSPNFCLPC